jgi:hypothetical protein
LDPSSLRALPGVLGLLWRRAWETHIVDFPSAPKYHNADGIRVQVKAAPPESHFDLFKMDKLEYLAQTVRLRSPLRVHVLRISSLPRAALHSRASGGGRGTPHPRARRTTRRPCARACTPPARAGPPQVASRLLPGKPPRAVRCRCPPPPLPRHARPLAAAATTRWAQAATSRTSRRTVRVACSLVLYLADVHHRTAMNGLGQ